MPSAEETTYLIESAMPETTQDFLSRDMDLLVSQIKENLRLSSLKAKSSVIQFNRANRALPYRISSRSLADPNCEMCCNKNTSSAHHDHRHHHYQKRTKERDEDDPYELLQELLREGGLIKEAVKRLQAINIEELANNSTEEEEEDEEEEDDEDEEDIEDVENNEPSTRISTRRRTTITYRRKPYFYDSEDETALPQVYQSLEL